MLVIKTLKVRVKDRHVVELCRMAKSVNFVWNYVNELSERNIKERQKFLSAYDIHPYTKGAAKDLGLHSQTIQAINEEYVTRRKQFKKAHLNWRKSYGSRRSLGWIPFKASAIRWTEKGVKYNKRIFQIFDSYGLENYDFRFGSFNEDARGRWYFNVVVQVEATKSEGNKSVGIDLGCKTAVGLSTGEKLEGRWYRELEPKLAIAQRANKKKETKNIHAKIKNRRKDNLHKLSRKLVDNNAAIFVGNVSSGKMSQTRMAKSTYDAGWYMLKTMLEYKCDHAGVVFDVVDEAWTTQVCSDCGCLSDSRPRGIADLGMREWTCADCGAPHDRDVNAAKNILAAGHRRLAEGIPVL